MARKQTLDAIIKLYQKLGGNISEVLGTKTNVNFIGKGEPDILRMNLNPEALGVVPQSKIIDELKDSVSYAASGKLNDLQANKLLENMSKIDGFYNPPVVSNITDLRTGVRDLDKEGLASLRLMADDYGYVDPERAAKLKELKNIDLPPPGSRGGPEDIAAPTQSADETFRNMAKAEGVDVGETILPTGAGLEAIKNVKNSNLIIDDIVDTIYLNAGVSKNAQPTARANAREFLNRVKDLEDPEFPSGTTLSSVMEADDFKFMTEGGGGGMGDPMLLVQKYFGPKVASAVAQLKSADDIQLFAERLIKVKDAKGKSVTDRFFNPESVDPNDFEFAEGGRVPFFYGGAARMGYQALAKYGIKPRDISRLFASLGTDKSLVGKEKTEYFKQLHKVLRNPDDFPDEILEIQKQLGIDIPGLKGGGLAKILEV